MEIFDKNNYGNEKILFIKMINHQEIYISCDILNDNC